MTCLYGVIDNEGGQSDSAYDDLNRLKTLTLSGTGVTGTSTAWAYDKTTADLTSVTKAVGGTASGTTAYGYDALGRNDSVTQSNGSGVTVGSYTYTRDLADRLTGSTFVTGGVTSSVTSSHSFSYYDDNQLKVADGVLSKYDDGGNLTGTYNAATGAQLSSLTYGTANRLQNDGVYTYTYDDAGQMTGKSKSGESWTYGYDSNGQMVSAGNGSDAVNYTFDAFGDRLSRVQTGGTSKTERFAYDGADAFLDLDGSNAVTVRRQYGPGVDHLLSRQSGGSVEWYGTDMQGSVRQVFDNKGNQTSWADYEAHGALVGGGTLTDRYGFTGREKDALTGQQYNRARVLDGQSWTSEDPMGFAAGDVNLRRYVGGNPMSGRDPSGEYDLGTTQHQDDWVAGAPDINGSVTYQLRRTTYVFEPIRDAQGNLQRNEQGQIFAQWVASATLYNIYYAVVDGVAYAAAQGKDGLWRFVKYDAWINNKAPKEWWNHNQGGGVFQRDRNQLAGGQDGVWILNPGMMPSGIPHPNPGKVKPEEDITEFRGMRTADFPTLVDPSRSVGQSGQVAADLIKEMFHGIAEDAVTNWIIGLGTAGAGKFLQHLGKKGWRLVYDNYGKVKGMINGSGKRVTKAEIAAEARLYCFPAGTLIHTTTGLRAIETLVAGDRVWAFDHRELSWVEREIIAVFEHLHKGVMATIEVAGETIRATGGHPFWVVRGNELSERPFPERISAYEAGSRLEGRWVLAKELRATDHVFLRHGELAYLKSVRLDEVEEPVYNFQVAELQNYAVGVCGVLVHNTSINAHKPKWMNDQGFEAIADRPGHFRRKSDGALLDTNTSGEIGKMPHYDLTLPDGRRIKIDPATGEAPGNSTFLKPDYRDPETGGAMSPKQQQGRDRRDKMQRDKDSRDRNCDYGGE